MILEQEWDQINGENALAFRAFTLYKNLGPDRSVEKAWELFVKESGEEKSSLNAFMRYSAAHRWVKRAAAWDNHLARLENNVRENEMRQIKTRERKNRLEMLSALRTGAAKAAQITMGEKATLTKTSDIKNAASIIVLYLEQSRIETGDNERGSGMTVNVNNNLELGDAVENAKDKLQSLLSQKPTARRTTGDSEPIQ